MEGWLNAGFSVISVHTGTQNYDLHSVVFQYGHVTSTGLITTRITKMTQILWV